MEVHYQVSFRHLQDGLTAGWMATEPLQGAFLHHGVVVFDLQQLPRCLGKKYRKEMADEKMIKNVD